MLLFHTQRTIHRYASIHIQIKVNRNKYSKWMDIMLETERERGGDG